MNVIDAIRDPNLFRPFLGDDLSSWRPWLTALRAVYGLPIRHPSARAIVEQCTGRDTSSMPQRGFDTSLFLTGRRSGKSRIAAIVGAFEAVLAGRESRLSPGERGVVAVCAPTKRQGTIVKNYIRALFKTPILANEVAGETQIGFELKSGTQIEILAGDFRIVRGFTLLSAIVDEAAFFGWEEESRIRSDTELIRAIKPGLATSGGKLIAISSPYARRGWCFQQYQRHHANDAAKVLVWNAPSRTMNSTLPQSVVDEAMAEDLAAAKSEFLAEFRDDVAEFLPRSVIEAQVVADRRELLPRPTIRYSAFVDLSGGRKDDAALAIAHRDGRRVVIDLLARRWKAPFNPHAVVADMAEVIRAYKVRRVVGDNYGGDFVSQAFVDCRIAYERAEKAKSILYAELLPRLCSGEIALPDDATLVDQLAGLERRTRAGGRDIIDHPQGGKDDLANAVAGVADIVCRPRMRIGTFRSSTGG